RFAGSGASRRRSRSRASAASGSTTGRDGCSPRRAGPVPCSPRARRARRRRRGPSAPRPGSGSTSAARRRRSEAGLAAAGGTLAAMSRRTARAVGTLVVTGLGVAYILWKIDVGRTVRLLADAQLGWFFASLAIMVVSVWPMAWRWQRLLAARGVHDGLG